MNSTTTMWLGMTATFFFTLWMISYNVKHLFRQQKAIHGVVLALDNIRYILMFISFMATISLVVNAGAIALENYELSTAESVVALVFIGSFAILASLAISGTMLWTERAFGEGGLTKEKLIAVILAFACVALLDTTSISKAYASVSNALESKKIKELDTNQNKNTSLIIDTKRDMVISIKTQLKDVSAEIANIDTLSIIPTKRMRELKAQIKRYEKKNKACPNTRKNLADLERKYRTKKLEELAAYRSTLQGKLISLTNSLESTATASEVAKSKAVEEIKKETQNNIFEASLYAFLGMILAIFISILRSIMMKDEDEEVEVEEIEEVNNDTNDKRHYVLEAMKLRAKDLQMELDMYGGTENLHFGRDAMRTKAIYLAKKDNKILSLSKDATMNLITDIKKRGGELEEYITHASWNQFKENDSNYADDLIAS